MFFDWTMLLVIPAAILAMYAQYKVGSTFKKYSNTTNRNGYTGADVAKMLLERAGIRDVRVEHVSGDLTDHYDPRDKVLRLSDSVYGSTSLAALGVAAHETGHAVQHDVGYAPLGIRNTIVPVVNFGNKLAMPMVIGGMILSSFSGALGMVLLEIGIILFAGVVVFQLITLPVEFNASSRAIDMLEDYEILNTGEITPAKKVLNAAALTYVAAAAVAVMNLLRFLIIAFGRRD